MQGRRSDGQGTLGNENQDLDRAQNRLLGFQKLGFVKTYPHADILNLESWCGIEKLEI